jgi:NADPH-dependent 2,4-dienoyl-CoA reductase/sulfur reductase-like enzyme
MSSDQPRLTGPDFSQGIKLPSLSDGGMLAGHAIGATCTHYGGPLVEGIVVGDTVRCPWHHACFSVRSGEAIRPPALNPIARFAVERRDGKIFVTRELDAAASATSGAPPAIKHSPEPIVIVGGGAAGDVAADTLRREGYDGPIVLVSADESAPYDRPNLSKDYLAGTAPEEWIPLRPSEFYSERDITLELKKRVAAIDVGAHRVSLDDGRSLEFAALLLATGASPVRLPEAVDTVGRVRYLRTLADSRAIKSAAENARQAVVIGASFIGLEVAASLRTHGVEVHVVAPESKPLERILGPDLGDFIRGIHETKGVVFHLGRTVRSIDHETVTLDDGTKIIADLVVAGIGVRPNEELAANGGLVAGRGIVVNEYLQTSAPGIYAAGDVARYPDAITGQPIRVEHWVAAQRQGQTAARNMLGLGERFAQVPFFWSRHYDDSISYVGHAERWDDVEISGGLEQRDCTITYRDRGKILAVATVGRDRHSLEAELALEETIGRETQKTRS